MTYKLLIAHKATFGREEGVRANEVIETLGEWIELRNSLYILWTPLDPLAVHEHLRRILGEEDLLTVADINDGPGLNSGALMSGFRRS
jgi:hypothetical protein